MSRRRDRYPAECRQQMVDPVRSERSPDQLTRNPPANRRPVRTVVARQGTRPRSAMTESGFRHSAGSNHTSGQLHDTRDLRVQFAIHRASRSVQEINALISARIIWWRWARQSSVSSWVGHDLQDHQNSRPCDKKERNGNNRPPHDAEPCSPDTGSSGTGHAIDNILPLGVVRSPIT